jgi:UDP-N-acetylmuramate dehydrogenase
MLRIKEKLSLKSYNTFGIDVQCDYFVEIGTISDFQELIGHPVYASNPRLVLGGGSNILFTKDFKGLIIKNNLKGITVVSENQDSVVVKVAAGEVWHDFVMWCIARDYAGLENLSLIPGCVGASPMQNILKRRLRFRLP